MTSRERILQKLKLDPKIRMVANGDEVVNALRAEQSASVAVIDEQLLEEIPKLREPEARSLLRDELPKAVRRGRLKEQTQAIYVNLFVELREGTDELPTPLSDRPADLPPVLRKENLVSAAIPLSELDELLADPAVVAVESAEQIRFHPPLNLTHDVRPPKAKQRSTRSAARTSAPQVLIGIIDVQGFDFVHPDFLGSDGKTRFWSIWDQGGETRPAPAHFGYGAEITADHMNAALSAEAEFGLLATELEPQSQMAVGSHATHVASIAAGNQGVCPEALIAGVLISLSPEDTDRRRSFYDSTRIAHAVDYIFALGETLDLPVSVNISLGTNGHAHDASSVTSRWIDYALGTAGRSICIAAGNAGQEAPAAPGDWGFVMGRIHTSGRFTPENPTRELEWVVIGDGIADLSENELEIWYSPQDRISIEVKPPDGSWIGPVDPGAFIENQLLQSGTFLSVYNELYAPPNGQNYIACYLSPFFSSRGVVGVRAGTWRVRLHCTDLRDGDFHAWIERDDPRRFGRLGVREAWAFPSFFTQETNVDNSSVSSLACGQRIISVANLDEAGDRIHMTSSQGPTRDGRSKPEIAAPGTDIVAAHGFDRERPWVAMTGTSMASPHVAGVIGRMLAFDRTLTAAQIGGILRRTARPLEEGNFDWRNDSGFGRIDPTGCLDEVGRLRERRDLTP